MGNSKSFSKADFDRYSLEIYEATLQHPCLLPDVGIDESLLTYSGINSNAALQDYSNELVGMLPGFVDRLGSSLGSMTKIPNAVGLGALVISMILELVIKTRSDDSYVMFRRVFGEEKASAVRDTMSEYLRRHRMFMNNDRMLLQELKRQEHQLSRDLTILKNSLLHDQQMSNRGFKIWVNGAAFHVQMLIHGARLNAQTCGYESFNAHSVQAAISLYLMDLDHLQEKFKHHMSGTFTIRFSEGFCTTYVGCIRADCFITNNDNNCRGFSTIPLSNDPCGEPEFKGAYMDQIFSRYEPISGLKSYFSNTQLNLNYLISQRGSFTLPSRG